MGGALHPRLIPIFYRTFTVRIPSFDASSDSVSILIGMKINKLHHKYAVLAVVLSILVGIAQGQTETPKKKDPFKRKSGAEEKAGAGNPEKMLVIGLQLAEVPSVQVREWDEKGLSGTEWRNNVQALVKEGKAKIVDSIAGAFKSGQRGKIQSALELRHPTVMQKISDSPNDPEFPKDFETMKLGIIFEADPVLSAEEDKVDLNFAFEWSRYLGEASGARTASDRIQAGDVLHPTFSKQKITTNIVVPIGEYQVLSRIEPNDKEKRDEFDIVVFGRVDLVVVNPFADQVNLSEVNELRIRGTWAEVNADEWHKAMHEHSLSQWFDGKAWASVQALEKSGKAKILASPVVKTGSGKRSKVEVGEGVNFQESFPAPGEETAEDKRESKVSQRILGHVVEMDTVLGSTGIVSVNCVSTSNSQHGYSVSYRRQDGNDWVPMVQFPKFYESAVTTQVSLSKNADLLFGVGTPPLESGHPDTSRKWVFFIHNDTFDER